MAVLKIVGITRPLATIEIQDNQLGAVLDGQSVEAVIDATMNADKNTDETLVFETARRIWEQYGRGRFVLMPSNYVLSQREQQEMAWRTNQL